MSRRGLVVMGAAGVVVLLGVGLSLYGKSRRESSPAAPDPGRTPVAEQESARSVPQPPPGGNLSIRGRVRDARGPVVGVHVSATRPPAEETLSEHPCPDASEDDEVAGPRGKQPPECMTNVWEQVLELVHTRHGEAPVYAQSTTAEDGSFVLEGLPEGEFMLWALGGAGAAMRPGVAAGTEGVELVLAEGVTLEGRVIDQDEQPLSGAQVTVVYEQHARLFDTRSGEGGRFHFGPLPRGEYSLVATKEGWQPTILPRIVFELVKGRVMLVRPTRLVGRVLSEGAAVPGAEVRLKGEEESGFEEQAALTDEEGRFFFERLDPATYQLSATRDGRHALRWIELSSRPESQEEAVLHLGGAFLVEGTVRDDARRPVAGAQVSVASDDEGKGAAEAITDEEGHYRLGPLEAGSYAFDILAAGYVDIEQFSRRLAAGTEPVDFTLRRGASLVGTVVDEEGRPVPEILLNLTSPRDATEWFEDSVATAVSDPEGRFILDAPRAGVWKIGVDDEGFLHQVLSARAPADGLRMVLRRGASVVGTVLDARGIPQERARVEVWDAKPQEDGVTRVEFTDFEGRFTLAGLKPGRYVVEAVHEREGVTRRASKPVELRGSEQVQAELRFEEGQTLSGIAVDGEGRPLSEVSIRVSAHEEPLPPWRSDQTPLPFKDFLATDFRTGPDGRFTLKDLVHDRYALTVERAGYVFVPSRAQGGEQARDNLLIARAGSTGVRLVLERHGHIRGKLVASDGSPIRRFSVNSRFVLEEGHYERGRPRTSDIFVNDVGGAFAVPFEDSGHMDLEFTVPGMAPLHRSLEVLARVDVDLGEVRMGQGQRLAGRVLDLETGEPVPRAQVQITGVLQDEEERPRQSSNQVLTREDGTFELLHMEEGSLVLGVHSPDYRPGRAVARAGGEPVTVRLDPGARLEISVRDHQGRPVDAAVSLEMVEGIDWRNLSVMDGGLVARGLPPGLFVARARAISSDSEGVFHSQRVQIPESGRVALSFVERKEGATLVLRMEDAGLFEVVLLPGVLARSVPQEPLEHWKRRGVVPEELDSVLTLRSLPPGPATLLVISGFHGYYVEELDLPSGGVLERVVSPRWQPLTAEE